MSGLYLRNFDEDSCAFPAGKMGRDGHPIEPEQPQERSFSETEVNLMIADARAAAIAEGKVLGNAEARAEVEASVNAQSVEIVQSIHQQLAEVSGKIDRHFLQIEQEMVELALGLAERLLPEILEVHGPDLLVARIRSGMAKARGNTALRIHVSETMQPLIQQAAERWKSQDFDHIDIVISADPEMADTATRLNWKNGYFEYNLNRACDELRQVLQRSVASLKDQLEKAE